VGSRDKTSTLLFGDLLHARVEIRPHRQERTGATVYNFYIDMRTAYKAYDEFYQRVLEEGTLFVRVRLPR